jgi:hypothetical protein
MMWAPVTASPIADTPEIVVAATEESEVLLADLP